MLPKSLSQVEGTISETNKITTTVDTTIGASRITKEVLDIMANLQETAILRRSSGVGSCLSLEDVMQRVAGRKVKPDLPNLCVCVCVCVCVWKKNFANGP